MSDIHGEDLRRRFYLHLILGHARQVQGFEDLVIQTLDTKFNHSERASVIAAFTELLRAAARSDARDEVERIHRSAIDYWRAHIELAQLGDNEPLADYLSWLPMLGAEQDDIYDIVIASTRRATVGHQLRLVLDFARAAPSADVTLRLVRAAVDRWSMVTGLVWHAREIYEVLDNIAPEHRTSDDFRAAVRGLFDGGALDEDQLKALLGGP